MGIVINQLLNETDSVWERLPFEGYFDFEDLWYVLYGELLTFFALMTLIPSRSQLQEALSLPSSKMS